MIGVLTEPLRGNVYSEDSAVFEEGDLVSYVPKTHVKFLEQAGIRVVPVDYRMPMEERFELMDQLSGLYMPGDSQLAVEDEDYKAAFVQSLHYLETAVKEKKEHFPMFMMGNSLQTLVRATQSKSGNLQPMHDLKHETLALNMQGMPHDTFFFNGMSREEKQAVFNTAKFFNKQVSGLRLKELAKDAELDKLLKPLATFQTDAK